MDVREVLERLEDHRQHQGEQKWEARCPAHEDRRFSLGVSIGEGGRVLLFCQAGCSTEEVVAKLGLKMADLFPGEEERPAGKRIVATYDYRDEAGVLLFQVVRYEPKDFRQRRPRCVNPRNHVGEDWEWKTAGTRQVVYRYPELLSRPSDETVFVVEGEKDVEAIRAIGLTATCNAGGASADGKAPKWKKCHADCLRGRPVVVIPDNDPAGEAHAAVVVASLTGGAHAPRLLRLKGLPPKGDVCDWLAAGHTADELLSLCASEKGPEAGTRLPKCFSHDQLLDAEFPPQTWLLDSLVPSGGLVILGGKKKLGKSWLCLQIAQAIAQGSPTLGRPTVAGPVAYICLEDGDRRLQDRLMKQQSPRGLPIRWFTEFTKLDEGGIEQLAGLLRTGPRLVIIDTLAAAKSGKVDENSSGPMGDIGNALRRLGQDHSCAIVVTHHHGKFSYGDPGDDLRGSSALAAAADLNLGLYRVNDGHRLRGEGRDIEAFDYAVSFDAHDTWRWKLLGDARTMAKEEADQVVLLALSNLGETDAATVARAVNRTRQAVSDRLNKLVEAKKVLMRSDEPEGKGRPRVLYRLPPADQSFSQPVAVSFDED